MDIPISKFANVVNFPICQFLDEFKECPGNANKEPISFMSGDPTVYGQKQF